MTSKIKPIKAPKGHKEFHSSNQKIVSGDYKGTAIKNKVGKIRDTYPIEGSFTSTVSKGKPPKSLA